MNTQKHSGEKRLQARLGKLCQTLLYLSILTTTYIALSSAVMANSSPVQISSGRWQGITPCVGGSAGYYAIEYKVRAKGEGGTLLATYETDRVYRKTFKDHKRYIRKARRARGIQYEYVDAKGLNSKNMYFFEGPTTTYLWTGTPNYFSDKCQEAILVKDNTTMFPNLAGHNEFCSKASGWAGGASYARDRIAKASNRLQIPGYNLGLALFGHQFSDRIFIKNFGRPFSDFSDTEIVDFIYRIKDCSRYSSSARHVRKDVNWLFEEQTIKKWAGMYPIWVTQNINRKYYYYYNFTEALPRSYLSNVTSILKEVRNASQRKQKIEDDLDSIFAQPESPELHDTISDFLSDHSRTLMFLDANFAVEVLELIAARREMLRASEALAKQFQLSEYPKLPPPDTQANARLVDDALLRPLTDEEIRLLEQSVEQDF